MSKYVTKKSLNVALCTALILSFGISVSACSGGEDHEVMAVDRVDDAAKQAIANGPEAEKIEFPVSTVAPATTTDADGTMVAADGTATPDMAAGDTDTTADATSTTTTDSAPAVSAESVTATADGAAADSQ